MWVYKNNALGGDHQKAVGDFREVFAKIGVVHEWGGKWAFGARSRSYMDGDVEVGHSVICYQTDKRAIIGLAEVAKLTHGEDARLWLRSVKRMPGAGVKIHELKRQGGRYAPLADMQAWKQGVISSLYPLDASEARFMQKLLSA
jgi:hypothetical protein